MADDIFTQETVDKLNASALTFNEVVTSRSGGVSTGAIIDQTLTPLGETTDTLKGRLDKLGVHISDWASTDGGTLTSTAQAFLNNTSGSAGFGNYYSWSGAFPKTVAPGTDPAAVGSGYTPRTDVVLRSELGQPTGPADILYAGEYLPCSVQPSKVSNLASAILAALSASIASNIYPVKMRQGVYLTTGLVIPGNSSLIGVDIPRMGMPGNWINGESNDTHGTIIRTADTVNPLFDMRVGSKVENVNVWQNGQTTTDNPATIVPFQPVFSITNDGSGGNSDNCVIRNVSALNCYDFMEIGDGINPVGRTIVEDVFANPMHSGIVIKSRDGDLPMLNRVFLENLFTTTPVYMPNLHAHIKANAVAFTIDYAQGVNMTDCIALSYGTGLLIQGPQAWAQIENFLADQCSLPLHVNGCDKIQINNFNFAQNVKLNGPTAVVEGAIGKQLSLSNGWFGDYYDNIKVGMHSKHTSGTITISSCRFGTSFPAVLNTGTGAVQISACGIGYDRVVGKNISIDGGPTLQSGASLGLTNINPTSPAATGWLYATPANVTAITGGVRLSGAGNNSITYNPGTVSVANNDKIYFGSQIYCLEFDLKVQNQAGSPRLDIQVINDSDVIVADSFQVCPDLSTSNSALPEGEVLHIALILPWSLNATKLRFSLPSQTNQVVEITNLDIKRVVIDKGFTGLEWFVGKTKLPGGYFNAKTGKQVMYYVDHPTGGVWSAGDEWEWAPTETPISGKKIGGFYTGTTWLSKGTFA